MVTRREFLAGVAAAGAIPAFARAAEPVTIVTPDGFLPDFIEVMNAASGGHFKRAGIDARIVGTNGSMQAMQQLVSGQAQFGRGSAIDLIRAVGTGHAALLSIATIYQASTFQIVSLQDKPITKGEELAGKTVGLVSVGGATDLLVDIILAKVGLKKDAIERRYVGNKPAALELERQGRIDCFVCTIAVVVALQRAGEKITYWSTDRYAPMPGQTYMTQRGLVERQPDLATRFLTAIKASADEIMAGPIAPIYQRAAKDYDIPHARGFDVLADVEEAIVKRLWLSQGKENLLRNMPQLFAEGVASCRSIGIADVPDPTQLYTNAIVDRVLKG
jgi:ABC-type nitrate/sulfonate/bicarbonate transport system substrate-binding protein